MSLGSSDDDIPGLESASSSECGLSEDDDFEDDMSDIGMEEDEEVNSKYMHKASLWMMFESSVQQQHIQVVHVFVLSPFLYGHALQSDRWLKWCHEVGLLQSDIEFTVEELSDKELVVVDVLLEAIKFVGSHMDRMSFRPRELCRLLQLISDIELQDSLTVVVQTARRLSWFITLIEDIRRSTSSFGGIPTEGKSYFVEIACLFVINQAVEHVFKVLEGSVDYIGDYKTQCKSQEESGKILQEEGEELEEKGAFAQAIETYTTAIVCCPYYYQLYINRANAYMEVSNYRASVADGLRALNLQPDNPKTHICYILALEAAGYRARSAIAMSDYHIRFPLQKDKLRRSLERLRHKDRTKRGPTAKETVLNDKLMATCKQASEAYLSGNLDEAVFYYEEAVGTSEQNEGWKTCWVFSDCELFLVSLRFAYGLSLLKKGTRTDAEKGLVQFGVLLSDYKFLVFPPAHYGMAKCLVLLHNHSEALTHIKKGLELLPSYRATPLTWPGTPHHILDIMPYDIETKLQQLLLQCEPQQVVDAVCRYPACLQHHTSTDIIVANTDYKGHVRMLCTEGCIIAYHPTCWRKFKGDCVIGADKDYLTTPCPTPDCEGTIKAVYIHNDKGAAKIKFETDKKTMPVAPPSSLNLTKETKRLNQNQGKAGRKKTEGETPESGEPKGLFPEGDEEEGVADAVMEDVRRGEGTLVSSKEEEQVSGRGDGGKSKGKKKVPQKEKSKPSSEHWNDLFSLPEREGLLQDPDDDAMSAKWEPNPHTPFQPPKHLKEIIDDFEIREAPAIGLLPRPSAPATAPTPAPAPDQSSPKKDKDIEFFVSYFGEIVRTHGPVDPDDPRLLEPLNYLHEDLKDKIVGAGGIAKLLVSSGQFAMQGKLICPIEELGIVTASMATSTGRNTLLNKDLDEPTSHAPKDGLLPLPPGERSAKVQRSSPSNGLLGVLKPTQPHSTDAGSKRNTSIVAPPKLNSPNSPDTSLLRNKKSKTSSVGSSLSERDSQHLEVKAAIMKTVEKARLKVESSKVKTELAVKAGSRSSSKDSSRRGSSTEGGSGRSGSGTEGGSGRGGLESSGAETDKRDLFSPTNSTSSMSSDSSGAPPTGVVAPSSKPEPPPPPTPTTSTTTSTKKNKKKSKGSKNTPNPPKPPPSPSVPAEAPLVIDKWVMTDALPPVESFKERYETALKEKKDLQQKLERSEDQRFKFQKSHKREMEQQLKQARQEAKEEVESKLREMEGRVRSESARVDTVKKENIEQIRSQKAEIKSLTEKIEKMKKEQSRKDAGHDNRTRQLKEEIEQLQSERQRCDDRLKHHKELEAKALIRATTAEVEVLGMRCDQVIKPYEAKIRDLDALCMTMPQGSDLHRECVGYRDKMKLALATYQGAAEDQLRLVKSGRDLSTLERIPTPMVQMPPQLSMMMMRGPASFYHPIIPISRAAPNPFPAPGMLDSARMMNLPRPPPATQLPMGGIPMGPGMLPPSLSQPDLVELAQPLANPSNAALSDRRPSSPSSHLTPPTSAAASSQRESAGASKKSSFDRIVESLGPTYPDYSREDFKALIREVRRSNKNSLSGLHLDAIAQQVKGLIEQRERKQQHRVASGGGAKAHAKPGNKAARPVDKRGGKKQRYPKAATAMPHMPLSRDYHDENSCIICYEEMREVDTSRLDCGHHFHSECIRSWFKEQSTCPTCRNHSLLVDDYPTLK